MKDLDEAAARLAADQFGAFAYRQLAVSRGARDRRVARGRWRRTVRSGVYVLAEYPPTWHQRLIVAVLGGPEGTVASHRSAAVLWDLREGTPIEITAPRGTHDRLTGGGVVHHSDVSLRTLVD